MKRYSVTEIQRDVVVGLIDYFFVARQKPMNKQDILAEEKRVGMRLLALRREYNSLLRGGAKRVIVTTAKGETKEVTVDCASGPNDLACLRQAIQAKSDDSIWTQKNVQVTDERPALGPWMSTEQLLRMGKPHVHIEHVESA